VLLASLAINTPQDILLGVTASHWSATHVVGYAPPPVQLVELLCAAQGIQLEGLQLKCSLVACMQTKCQGKLRAAQKTTRKEFEDIMLIAQQAARARLAALGLSPFFSWDNNRIQATANLANMGILPHEKVPLAPYMPDAHKVIEHTFARIKAEVKDAVYLLGPDTVMTPALAQSIVYARFWQQQQATIRADVDSLPLTYAAIARQGQFTWLDGSKHTGVAGNWPAKKYR
jgi:uncharacterized membrane protein